MIKSGRKSNFDLFRMFSIFLVVLYHYVLHGHFIDDTISYNNVILIATGSYGSLGVLCFIIISSYFLFNKENSFSFKKCLKIFFETSLYSFGISLILYVLKINYSFNFNGITEPMTSDYLVKCIFSIFFNQYWFMTIYFLFYLFSPCIKVLINNISKNYHRTLIIVIFFLIIIGQITDYRLISTFFLFIFMYLVTAYFLKYNNNFFEKNYKKIALVVLPLTVLLLVFIYYNYHMSTNPQFYEKLYVQIISSSSPLMIIDAVILYFIFKNLKIKYSRFLSIIGASTLGIYIIHEHNYFHSILFDYIFKRVDFHNSPYLIFIYFLTCILVVVICTIVDRCVNLALNKTIYKLFTKKCGEFFKKIDFKYFNSNN